MSEGQRSKTAEHEHLPPGAERFWGQVSETRAGRSQGQQEPAPGGPDAEPEEARDEGQTCLEWCPICRSADLLRATASPEAIGQVQAIQHEAVNVLKSFLATYGERSEGSDSAAEPGESAEGDPAAGGHEGGPPVRDISID